MLTRIYQEGLHALVTGGGGGSRWPVASACHTLNRLPDSRSPAEPDLAPRPVHPMLHSLARTLPALQQAAADARAQLRPSPAGTQRAEQTPNSSLGFF